MSIPVGHPNYNDTVDDNEAEDSEYARLRQAAQALSNELAISGYGMLYVLDAHQGAMALRTLWDVLDEEIDR
jgi:hypothetical protein